MYMKLNNLLIIIIFFVLIGMVISNIINKNINEGFYTSNTVKEHKDYSIFYDQQFKNTKYYENDGIFKNTIYYENDDTGATGNKGLLTGWQKCKLSCPGHCLEYGVSGNTWCFDPKTENARSYGDEFSGKEKYQQENTTKTSDTGYLSP